MRRREHRDPPAPADRARRGGLWRRLRRAAAALPPGLRSLAGLALVVGGAFGFLPVLGFWMIPLGLLLVWTDLAALLRARPRPGPAAERDPPAPIQDRLEGPEAMQTPLELSFTDMEPDADLEALVREKVAHLEKMLDRITSCHVYVRAPHQSQRKGNLYGVRIEVRVPGDELFVDSGKDDAPEHEHPQVAIRDAFRAMERQVKTWKQKAARDVKTHEGPLQGRIAEIHHDEGYGQIIATDHRLVYFHRNSVVEGDFEELQPRDTVELVVQTGESEIGPQASTVRPIGALKYDPS
jgi:ribosome-associated translation inhibitor RaiA